jgi:hypothetical protein
MTYCLLAVWSGKLGFRPRFPECQLFLSEAEDHRLTRAKDCLKTHFAIRHFDEFHAGVGA